MEQKTQNVWQVCSCSAVKRASRRLAQLYEDVLEPTGLRITQFSLLAQIELSDRPSLRQLADAMVMDLSALGHTLKPLARDGLVSLAADPRDRRVKRVSLTDAGRRRLVKAERYWSEAQGRFEQVLGGHEARALRAVLAEVSSEEFAARFAAADDGKPPS